MSNQYNNKVCPPFNDQAIPDPAIFGTFAIPTHNTEDAVSLENTAAPTFLKFSGGLSGESFYLAIVDSGSSEGTGTLLTDSIKDWCSFMTKPVELAGWPAANLSGSSRYWAPLLDFWSVSIRSIIQPAFAWQTIVNSNGLLNPTNLSALSGEKIIEWNVDQGPLTVEAFFAENAWFGKLYEFYTVYLPLGFYGAETPNGPTLFAIWQFLFNNFDVIWQNLIRMTEHYRSGLLFSPSVLTAWSARRYNYGSNAINSKDSIEWSLLRSSPFNSSRAEAVQLINWFLGSNSIQTLLTYFNLPSQIT